MPFSIVIYDLKVIIYKCIHSTMEYYLLQANHKKKKLVVNDLNNYHEYFLRNLELYVKKRMFSKETTVFSLFSIVSSNSNKTINLNNDTRCSL